MRTKRFLSFLMTLVMLAGMVTPFSLITFADEAKEEDEVVDYTKEVYLTPEDKLATMGAPVYTNGDLELYYHSYTGEVLVRNAKTKQLLSTNPHNVGSAIAAETVKRQLLSQLILTYKDNQGLEYVFDSYSYAAENQQIVMKKIKGGIRVEYAIGLTQKKKIVPRYITAERFEALILEPMNEADPAAATRLAAFYMLKDAQDPEISDRTRAEILSTYPITAKKAIYVIAPDIKAYELDQCEQRILKYTGYTLEDMLADHEECNYVLEDDSPPLFKMSLEYYLNNNGVTVNLPARGISYDSSKYNLIDLKILPYFGAGFNDEKGYNFVPDGSGALIEFDDVKTTSTTVAGMIYGNDFGFYNVTGGNMQVWRYPVYGVVTTRDLTELKFTQVPKLDENDEPELDEDGNQVYETVREVVSVNSGVKQGFFAIIEEGESLAKLSSEHGGTLHHCNSGYITVYPRQSDSYPLDGITVSGGAATYEVNCERKYVGNFKTRYIMLFEDDANYVGMANTYRQYLKDQGAFDKIDGKDGDDIKMFLEVFGALETTEKIMGMPVNVMTPLTTFSNAQLMLELLRGKVINQDAANTVAKIFADAFTDPDKVTVDEAQKVLTEKLGKYGGAIEAMALRYVGWYNGGMIHTPPSKLDVDGAVGGDEGLKALVKYLSDTNTDFYPDLDFAYVKSTGLFDNFDHKTDAAKTVDGKPAWIKEYDFILQTMVKGDYMLISATVLEKYHDNIKDKFAGIGSNGVSLGTLGESLNSSQDENDPVNREEAKELVLDLLKAFKESGKKILVNGGNEYTLQYADAVLNAPLDSNARVIASYEVPFVGMVLHGYVEFTGEAINLAGDYEYTLLKTIENGANPYFVLSYENTSELKTSGLTDYYAIQFDIWYDEVIDAYNKINSALSQVTGSVVTAHEFVGDRIVKVTYSNGVSIVLNYNNFAVEAEGVTLDAMGFQVL